MEKFSLEEVSNAGNLGGDLGLNKKQNKQSFMGRSVELSDTSETDILDRDLDLFKKCGLNTHKSKVDNHREEDSPRVIVKKDGEYNEAETSYDEKSSQDFIIAPVKVTKSDKRDDDKQTESIPLAKSQHHQIVTERFSGGSSDISRDGSFTLHNKLE